MSQLHISNFPTGLLAISYRKAHGDVTGKSATSVMSWRSNAVL